jgi:hypothetical protein
MTLVNLDLRPGVYATGTPYVGRGRWADSNLVRWKDGAIRVVGGWERRKTSDEVTDIPPMWDASADEAARGIFSWQDNTISRQVVVGTNRSLYHLSDSGVVTDITPYDLIVGARSAGFANGYGVGAYGGGPYGTARSGGGRLPVPVITWSFTAWGAELLAQVRGEGPVWAWAVGDPEPAPVPNAPENFQDIVVTTERILMGIGGTGDGRDPRTVTWSERENRELWTPDETNQAGSLRLAGFGKLLSLHQVLNQVLILGENDLHIARYIGPPFVYGFEKAGEGCGAISAAAVVTTDRFAIWLSETRSVWLWDGTLRRIESDIADFFVNDVNFAQRSKTFGFMLRDFDEVWWLYQSNDSPTDEPDSYICFDYAQQHWTKGKLDRCMALDRGVTRDVLMVDPMGVLWNHELRNVSIEDGPIPFVETGPLEIGAGDQHVYVDYIYPDENAPGGVTAIFKVRDMPNGPETVLGPYSMASPVGVRARGRQFSLRLEGRTAGWRVGSMRVNIKPGERR